MTGASHGRPGRPDAIARSPRPSPVRRTRVRLTARVTLAGADEADALVQLEYLSAHPWGPALVEIELDMSALTRCGPDLIAAVRELRERMDERGGVLTVRGRVADVVLEALDSAPLHDVFAFYAMLRETSMTAGTARPTHGPRRTRDRVG